MLLCRIVALVVLASTLAALDSSSEDDTRTGGIVAVIAVLVFIAGFACSLGPGNVCGCLSVLS
jgi:hypothetical protein